MGPSNGRSYSRYLSPPSREMGASRKRGKMAAGRRSFQGLRSMMACGGDCGGLGINEDDRRQRGDSSNPTGTYSQAFWAYSSGRVLGICQRDTDIGTTHRVAERVLFAGTECGDNGNSSITNDYTDKTRLFTATPYN